MKKVGYLFPYRFKKIGGFVFWSSFLSLMVYITDIGQIWQLEVSVFTPISYGLMQDFSYFSWVQNNIIDEILFALMIISGLIYAFSCEKTEDEMTQKIRLDSLVWATYFNYIIILLSYLLLFDFSFLYVMMVALFSQLLFFIIRFRWIMYKTTKMTFYEE